MSAQNRGQILSGLNRAARQFVAGSTIESLSVAGKLGMLPIDLQLLNFLDLNGPATPGLLARQAGLSSGGVTVALDRLEKAGTIRRRANPADRRSWLIGIRPMAARRIAAKYAAAQKQSQAALAQFTKAELKIVLRFLSAANEPRLRPFEGGTQGRAR
jgi:DNA-binding MarR family transcriptional regulator